MNKISDFIIEDKFDAKIDAMLDEYIALSNYKIIVLDDDPTGIQTVHDVYVYTDWEEQSIRRGFEDRNNMFYILTNSRGFTKRETTICHEQIIGRVIKISKELRKDYIIISRSDSTLRGHYPLETQVLKNGIETYSNVKIDGEILCPFFKEGGRFTFGNIHYVKQGEDFIPAAKTEFAKDKTFGYKSSDLCEYVEEKTNGQYKASMCTSIDFEDLRQKNIDFIYYKLMSITGFNKVIVNAMSYGDLKVFMTALYRALMSGKNFLYRTAAGFVKIIGGISDAKLLTREELIVNERRTGGIVVIGSHTDKTTRQLEQLRQLKNLHFIELDSDMVLNDSDFEKEVNRVIELENKLIEEGGTVVVYTKRKLLSLENDTKEEALIRSVKISDAVQSLVGRLSAAPNFVVAKGGITSSDIGTKALGVKRANVLGQISPGIPVWQTGIESLFPLIPYVIFPGNVGEDDTLKEVVEKLL